jgi:transposase
MKKTRTKYTKEFKQQTVQLMLTRPHSEIARELGVNASLLYKWRDQLQEHGEQAFPGHGHKLHEPTEHERLLAENERLKAENDFLKKTAVFFAKHCPST